VKDIERMVISAYTDGEVETPWKEQVERKILENPDWAAEAALQERLSARLNGSPEPDFSEAQARILGRITESGRSGSPSRSFATPWISVAAAALLILAASGGYWWGRQSTSVAPAEVSELQVQVPSQLELKLSGEGQLLMASTLQGNRP